MAKLAIGGGLILSGAVRMDIFCGWVQTYKSGPKIVNVGTSRGTIHKYVLVHLCTVQIRRLVYLASTPIPKYVKVIFILLCRVGQLKKGSEMQVKEYYDTRALRVVTLEWPNPQWAAFSCLCHTA